MSEMPHLDALKAGLWSTECGWAKGWLEGLPMGMKVYMGCFFFYTKGSDSQARTTRTSGYSLPYPCCRTAVTFNSLNAYVPKVTVFCSEEES